MEKVSKSKNSYEASYAQGLLDKLEGHPELNHGSVDYSVLEKHREFVDELMTLLFPTALTLNEIKSVGQMQWSHKSFLLQK